MKPFGQRPLRSGTTRSRLRSVAAVAVQTLALSASTGCLQSGGQCPRPKGSFTARLTPLSGNCTKINTRPIFFDDTEEDTMILIKMTLSDTTRTEVNLIGCSVVIDQIISDPKEKRVLAQLKGDLSVEGARALSGYVSYQEFAPDGTTQACSSELQVNLVQEGAAAGGSFMNDGRIGAAAEAALNSTEE
jgi:hypothetical protein